MLSDKINSLPISQTVAMTAKAHDLKNQGIDVNFANLEYDCSRNLSRTSFANS